MKKNSILKFKIVKGLLMAGLLIFAMLYESTLFTDVLYSFHTTYFDYSIFSCTREERQQFINDVRQYAMEEKVSVFSVDREQSGNISKLRIFTDDDNVKKQIQKKSGITEKNFTTFAYGVTDVVFMSFDELKHDRFCDVNFICYVGSDNDVKRLYTRMNKKYDINMPSRTENNKKSLVVIVWTLIAGMHIFMTFWEIAGYQTGVAEEFRNGESASEVVSRFMLLEALVDFAEYFVIKGAVSLIYSGQVFPYFGMVVYSAAILVSCLLYIYYAFFKWERLYTKEKKPIGFLKPVLFVFILLFAANQYLTNRLNDQLTENFKNVTAKNWFRKEMDGYTLIVKKASPFSFMGQVDIEYYGIPDSSITYLQFEAFPNKLGGISYITIGFETSDGSGGIVFLDRYMNYQQPSPENMESARNARKLISKYQNYVDKVIDIANGQWELGIGK